MVIETRGGRTLGRAALKRNGEPLGNQYRFDIAFIRFQDPAAPAVIARHCPFRPWSATMPIRR
jgi:hypothetical protein